MSLRIIQIPAWVTETNAWIVTDGDLAFLVDAPPDPDAIGKQLADLDVTVSGVLLTHGHVDHTGGAGRISASTGAKTYVHPDDDFLTLHPAEQLKLIFGMTPPGDYDLPTRFETLSHGQRLDLGGIAVDVRHTPGHTPGHCCFYLGDEGVLFSGDQLFAGSVGRTDLPGGSYEDLMSSMKSHVLDLADEVRVLPGHGPETTIGRERRFNPFLTDLG